MVTTISKKNTECHFIHSVMPLKKSLFLILLVFCTGQVFGQNKIQKNAKAILILQSGNENLLLSNQSNLGVNLFLQEGDNNKVISTYSQNLTVNQLGQLNETIINGKVKNLTVTQEGDKNSFESYGENSLINGASLLQTGNRKLIIFNN